jgi:hypothetical protein
MKRRRSSAKTLTFGCYDGTSVGSPRLLPIVDRAFFVEALLDDTGGIGA